MHNNSPDPRTIHSCTLFALHISYWSIGSLVRMTKRPRVTTWGGAKIILFLHYTSQLLMMYDDA